MFGLTEGPLGSRLFNEVHIILPVVDFGFGAQDKLIIMASSMRLLSYLLSRCRLHAAGYQPRVIKCRSNIRDNTATFLPVLYMFL